MNKIKKNLGIICAVALATPVLATPTLLFDNADAPLNTTFRGPSNLPLGVGAYLSIGANNVSISQIAINAAPGQSGQLKFFIFSDTAGGSTAGSLLFSDTVNVTASATLGYILSDAFSFTLLAGQYYDIGAIFNGTNINYSYDGVANTQNGISSIVANANADNFANPFLTSHAGADINIRLYGGNSTVPDGGTTAMLLAMALSGVGYLRRKV